MRDFNYRVDSRLPVISVPRDYQTDNHIRPNIGHVTLFITDKTLQDFHLPQTKQ